MNKSSIPSFVEVEIIRGWRHVAENPLPGCTLMIANCNRYCAVTYYHIIIQVDLQQVLTKVQGERWKLDIKSL